MGRWRYKILLKFYEIGVAENNQFQGNSARLSLVLGILALRG